MQDNYSNVQKSENEVEIEQVGQKISGFFNSILESIFSFFISLWKYKWITLSAIVLGLALGIVLEITKKPSYNNEVVVAANFGSNDYLYSNLKKFSTLRANADSPKDSLLLSKISSIEIEPLQDGYTFILSNYYNLQAFRLLSDRGIDLEKYFKSKMAEKNYRYHSITFKTSVPKDSTEIVINHLLDKLNATTYFNSRMAFEKNNIQMKRNELIKSVEQLNSIFSNFGNATAGVSLNDYSNMEELFMSKEYLLNQINRLEVEQLESSKVIFDIYRNTNAKGFSIPAFLYLPILFVLLLGISLYLYTKYQMFSKKYI